MDNLMIFEEAGQVQKQARHGNEGFPHVGQPAVAQSLLDQVSQ